MSRRIIGLDIGNERVKVVHVESRSRLAGYQVVAFFEQALEPSPVLEDPLVNLMDRQKKAVLALKDQGAFSGGHGLACVLPGHLGQMRELAMPLSDEKKIESAIEGELDATIPFSVDEIHYGWFLIPKQLRKKLSETSETSKQNVFLSEIIVGYCKKDAFSEWLLFLKELKLDPRYVYPKASLGGDFFYQNLSKEMGFEYEKLPKDKSIGIVDIGHLSTTISVFTPECQLLGRVLLRGGYGITKHLSQKDHIPFEEAEAKKLTAELPAALLDRTQMDGVAQGYESIAREIRQSLIQVRARGYETPYEWVVIGRGAYAKGLEVFLKEELEVPIRVIHEVPIVGQMMPSYGIPAAACAFSALLGDKRHNRLNLRKGNFVWKGELDHVRSRTKPLLKSLLVIYLLSLVYGYLGNQTAKERLQALEEQTLGLCKDILGEKVTRPEKCISTMKSVAKINSNYGLPQKSALDVYLSISESLPSTLNMKLTDLEITEETMRMSGETQDFESVDEVVNALSKNKCFASVEKGKARKVEAGVAFQLSSPLDCNGSKSAKPSTKKNNKKGKKS